MPLLDILDRKAHPVLQRQPGKPEITRSRLMDEIAAAAKFGWDAYWDADRPARTVMTAHVIAQTVLDAMSAYDTRER